MAATTALSDEQAHAQQHPSKWNNSNTDNPAMDVEPARDHMGPGGDMDANGASNPVDDRGAPKSAVARADNAQRGEKLIKPNKVYIGGLPEHTRKEDLESCFGKIGNIVNIELKVGYGFVEFDNREAAEESVAKYHEGYFMGNKIRVEISHGGGRTAKYSGDPGACFKCGQMGHWARECPNLAAGRRATDAPLIDRIHPPREYLPPPRDYYRDYPGYYPHRDPRYYDYPPPPPPPGRERAYGRPPSPVPRDYPPPPVPARSARDYDDYRMRGPPPLPPARYDARGYYPEGEPVPPSGYPPRGYPPPPPRDYYDRYDRRAPPAADSDYPPAAEIRGRPVSPPPARYADYPPRSGSAEATRYRSARSRSPPSRSASGAPYESSRYESGSGAAAYTGGTSGTYAGNGYSSTSGGAPPPTRGSGTTRDYAPPRSSRDAEPASSYRRT
ncbi:hypothetical protein BN946_scf184990.g22 [Trametes cinnabarina]|uniref:CCHC-type domain-containing protein n=1 Tax=Pycnoporus cinnabarinus TaxID=5643 RepID=A0A060SKI3_PYCCI|nr:hypothetical protein BN946_scf184990.g22 [Trametes cinnabarina]